MKKYILYAGVNGSGKSTLYYTTNEYDGLPRVNTDEIVATFGDWRNSSDVVKAGKIAIKKIKEYFSNGQSFVQETTLCGKSIVSNISYAKENGYEVIIHYVGVESVEIAKERILKRVSMGGHGIPDKDVERRYTESLKNLSKIIPCCDEIYFFDNTDTFRHIATINKGVLVSRKNDLPMWFQNIKKEWKY